MSCGVGQQMQLQLDPLTWELPYAAGATLKRLKQKQKKPLQKFKCDLTFNHEENRKLVYYFPIGKKLSSKIFTYLTIYVCMYFESKKKKKSF